MSEIQIQTRDNDDRSIVDENYVPPNLSEVETTAWQRMSARVRQQLQDLDFRLRGPVIAQVVWEELLTREERAQLGNDLEIAWNSRGTLGLWMEVKGFSDRFAALVDLSDHLNDPRKRLAQAVSIATTDGRTIELPCWSPSIGVLEFEGAEIRHIRLFRHPSNIQLVVAAFHNAGWPRVIDNPLDDPRDQQRLHRTLNQLNKGLRRIRFSGVNGGSRVTWNVIGSMSE